MHSEYDSMPEKHMNGALKCTNNVVIISKYYMLSMSNEIADHSTYQRHACLCHLHTLAALACPCIKAALDSDGFPKAS